MYDIAIIGAGVVGGQIAYNLCGYDVSLVMLEKENDVAMGQSKANSGIVHGGYDPKPGSLKARLNVQGSKMMEEICSNLQVKYKKNGSLVVAYTKEELGYLDELLSRGRENGVEDLEIIDGARVRKFEKNLSENIIAALYVPSGAVVCPYELTINSIGHAMDNGMDLRLNFSVEKIEKTKEGYWRLMAENGEEIFARLIINCAGVHGEEVARLIDANKNNMDNEEKLLHGKTDQCKTKAAEEKEEGPQGELVITPRRGQYLLLDKECNELVNMTIFRTPTKMGKGVLATKTASGNILLGPTSEDIGRKEDTATTRDGLSQVILKEGEFFDEIPLASVITQFSGIRAHGNKGDFVIENSRKDFINVIAIESPGLTSAPAIGKMVWQMLKETGINLPEKKGYSPVIDRPMPFKTLSFEEKNKLVRENPAYGRIVCRCEEVTEGEILEAIRNNPRARDVDGIKRRTRSGMGRCQGGFCLPSVMEILARENHEDFCNITKKGGDSYFCIRGNKGKKTGGQKV